MSPSSLFFVVCLSAQYLQLCIYRAPFSMTVKQRASVNMYSYRVCTSSCRFIPMKTLSDFGQTRQLSEVDKAA